MCGGCTPLLHHPAGGQAGAGDTPRAALPAPSTVALPCKQELKVAEAGHLVGRFVQGKVLLEHTWSSALSKREERLMRMGTAAR